MFRKSRGFIYDIYFKMVHHLLPVNIYLFNSPYGYHDNTKYLMAYFYEKKEKVYWVSTKKNIDGSKRGIMSNSFILKLLLPRVKVCFITHGYQNVCKSIPSAITIVNLWHGIALKKMGYDSMLDIKKFNLREKNPYLRNDYLISSSDVTKRDMQSCMNLYPRKVLALGQPRTDILFEKGKDKVYCQSIKSDASKNYNTIFLYAPTFRDSGGSEHIYRRIVDSFVSCASDNSLLILRLHPEDKSIGEALIDGARNVMLSSTLDPIQDLLMADVLISDYSSIIFDFMILERPIYLFTPDYSSYMSDRSGFYFDYDDIMKGTVMYKNALDSQLWCSPVSEKRHIYPAVNSLHNKKPSASVYNYFH